MADISDISDRTKKQKRHECFIVYNKNGPVGLYKTKCPTLGAGTRAMRLVLVIPDATWDRYKPPSAEVTVTPDNLITPEIQVLDALAR